MYGLRSSLVFLSKLVKITGKRERHEPITKSKNHKSVMFYSTGPSYSKQRLGLLSL